MSKAVIFYLIVIFAITVVELKPLSEVKVECNSQPGGCAPEGEKINPRSKRHLHCLFYPQLCMPQYVPVYYPAVTTVQGGHTYNIVNGYGNHNSVVISQG